jgi:hypothetical protein
MSKRFLIAAVLISFASPALAQQSDRERGDRACRTDAVKLCKKVLDQGDFAVLGCFQQNSKRLTKSCRTFLVEMGQLQ